MGYTNDQTLFWREVNAKHNLTQLPKPRTKAIQYIYQQHLVHIRAFNTLLVHPILA
jgi:hypothetical protein